MIGNHLCKLHVTEIYTILWNTSRTHKTETFYALLNTYAQLYNYELPEVWQGAFTYVEQD